MTSHLVCPPTPRTAVCPPVARISHRLDLARVAAANDLVRSRCTGSVVRLGFEAGGWMCDDLGRRVLVVEAEGGDREPARATLLSVCVRAVHEGDNDSAFSCYVEPDPDRSLQPEAVRSNGLTPERLRALGAVTPRIAMRTLAAVLPVLAGGKPVILVGHDVGYDRRVLLDTAVGAGRPLPVAGWYDTQPTTQALCDIVGDRASGSVETFVRLTTTSGKTRGARSADQDVALLARGLRRLACLGGCLGEPERL
jgi:hypothetical protein